MDKALLRENMKQKRALLTQQEHQRFSQQAADMLLGSELLLNCENIGVFSSIGSEIDTTPLFADLTDSGRRVFFPKMDNASRSLTWGPVDTLASMVKGPYGVLEPERATNGVADLDLIVVPGLGFGLNGGRLGYGAGWYDRTLELFEGKVVGFGFECQVLEAVPTEVHDHPVHWIVTELRAIPLGG